MDYLKTNYWNIISTTLALYAVWQAIYYYRKAEYRSILNYVVATYDAISFGNLKKLTIQYNQEKIDTVYSTIIFKEDFEILDYEIIAQKKNEVSIVPINALEYTVVFNHLNKGNEVLLKFFHRKHK